MVYQPCQFREDDAQVFGALGNFYAGEFFDTERVGPVVRHRAKIIEPIGIRHRAEVAGVLANLLVIAMEITEDRFEFAHDLAFEGNVHPENAVGRGMLRAHRDFQQLAVETRRHPQPS